MTNPLLDTDGLPRFAEISPDDVIPALSELIASNRAKLNTLLENAPADFDSVVVPLETMEHDLSRVWSPVSHLQGVLGSPGWRQAYNEALPILTEYGTELSQDTRLQHAFASVAETLADDGPERAIVEHALRDFKLAGVDLPEADKARFKQIMQELAGFQARFDQNIQDASDSWRLVIVDEAELAGIPEQAIQRARDAARTEDRDGWLLTLDYPTYDAVVRFADNRALRENLYHGWVTRASDEGADPAWDNSDNIERILALRHEAANIVGFANYAEYSLATKMADTPADVIRFLEELADRSSPAAAAELAELTKLAGMAIEPWDTAYYLEKLKAQKYAVSDDELRQYFQADRVVDGLFELASRLYGLAIERVEGITAWHDDVRYYRVAEESGGEIGGFFADLYARSGKRTGAWISDLSNRMRVNGRTAEPEGFLVCNFPPPDERGMSLLGHDDVVTLFHEFGHMLHHLLTRIDYPSIAGINGVPWDAVELPSQFMENFAWSYEVLERCTAHRDSNAALPRELFDRLDASRHVGAALGMLRQIEFGLYDARLHAELSLIHI